MPLIYTHHQTHTPSNTHTSSNTHTHHQTHTAEINELLARNPQLTYTDIGDLLTPASQEVFGQLPVQIQLELLLERDTHGNVQICQGWGGGW